MTDLVRRHRKSDLTIAGIGLTMNTATDCFLRTPEDAAGKDMLELMEALRRTPLAKRSGGASRTFRLTPPTPCTACWPCTPFSWMLIWSSIPTAGSGSLRWTRCRPQRISSTGSSAPRHSASCAIWQKREDVICPPVTSCDSTIGIPIWAGCRRCAGGWTARHVRTIRSRCTSSGSESGRRRTAWYGKPRGYWRAIRKFPCGKPTSRNSMPSCRR